MRAVGFFSAAGMVSDYEHVIMPLGTTGTSCSVSLPLVRKAWIAVAAVAASVALSLASAAPAGAMCRPGSIGLKPKPHVELPHCETFPP